MFSSDEVVYILDQVGQYRVCPEFKLIMRDDNFFESLLATFKAIGIFKAVGPWQKIGWTLKSNHHNQD